MDKKVTRKNQTLVRHDLDNRSSNHVGVVGLRVYCCEDEYVTQTPESTQKPTDSDSDEHDESRDAEDAKPSWRTRMAERFKPKNKVRLALFIGVAIFVGQWAWKEFGDKLTHANVG
ncbi:MAG: hypothetical protein R3B55_02125 [Candidatus Paceibacterota bacterium]